MARSLKDYALIGLRGMAMGAADVIPGVSGGTIALITGIYEELINSIKSFNRNFISILFSQGIPSAWKYVNGNFLVSVISGILISIFSLANLITWLMEHHPLIIWSFFFGLIVASAFHVGLKITRWGISTIIALIAGTLVAAWITIATPAETTNQLWFVFVSGAIAIIAMILPGISGSFILLLMGKYTYILGAVQNFDLVIIFVFGMGCLIGIISFSNVVAWLFKKYPQITLAVLTGFMAGSLNKLWPWKQVISYSENSHGEMVPLVEKSISPFKYESLYNEPHQLISVISAAILGFLIIFLFDLYTLKRLKNKNSSVEDQ